MENIKDLAAVDRPREKLITGGASDLTDAELLAILLGSGTQELPVLALCGHILETAGGNLEELAMASLEELCGIKGIGTAKAAIIIAAMEIGRRRLFRSHRVPKIKTQADAIALVSPYFKASAGPLFVLVLLNRSYELLAVSELSISGTDLPDIGYIAALAIKAGATGFGLAANKETGPQFLNDLKAASDMLKLRFFGLIRVD